MCSEHALILRLSQDAADIPAVAESEKNGVDVSKLTTEELKALAAALAPLIRAEFLRSAARNGGWVGLG